MLKLTYNAHGAHLSNAEGFVTHELLRPMWGQEGTKHGKWVLYALTGPYSKKHVGRFDSAEDAKAHVEQES